MKATKIRMKCGCKYSTKTTEIADIYVVGCTNPGFFSKENLHNYLKDHPGTIYVDISPYPQLLPATSANGEKYVRSEAYDTPNDNLLKLPRV